MTYIHNATINRRTAASGISAAWLILVFTVAMTAGSVASLAQPYIPSDDAEVLEILPKRIMLGDQSLRDLRAKLKADPKNQSLAIKTAKQYISLGRAEGEPRYYGYAQAALAPWWTLTDPPAEIGVLRAIQRQALHDFTGALSDLSRVLGANPNNPQAWLSRSIIQRVLGDYGDAVQSCRRLGNRVAAIFQITCISASQSLNGRARESYTRLDGALAQSSKIEPRIRLWALTVLGEIAERSGDPKAAEKHFREALALGLKNAYLLGAYADLLLDEKRYADARELLKDEKKSDPLLLRLAFAEAGNGGAQTYIADLRARFDASRRRGGALHLREEARFTLALLDTPDKALRLALRNWQLQREPWDARMVLEAALAAGDLESAAPVVIWLAERRLESVRLQGLVEKIKNGGV